MSSLLKVLRFLLEYSKRGRSARASILVVCIAGISSGAASAGLIKVITASVTRTEGSPLLAWSFLALCILLPLSWFVSTTLLLRLSNRAVFNLRIQLANQFMAAPLRHLEALGPPRLLASLTDDVNATVGAIAVLPRILMNLALILGCLIYMAWLSWKLVLIIIAAMAIGVIIFQISMIKAQSHFRIQRGFWDQLFGHFSGLVNGTKELKIHRHRREAFMTKLLKPSAESLLNHSVAGGTIYNMANSWSMIIFYGLIGLVLYVLPLFFNYSTEVLTAYTFTILFLIGPIGTLTQMLPNLGMASIALDKIRDLGFSLEEETMETDKPRPPAASNNWASLKLIEVTHAYHVENKDEEFLLGPINLTISTGELIFIVGGNGSGKTTLAKLLIGLYVPEGGECRLDDQVISDGNRDLYRQLFSVVFTDFYLFEQLLGLEYQGLDRQAQEYLTKLHLDGKTRVVDGTLSTTNLSQGQRKRLALLTAFLENRSIYLFDEWAADQDPQFKRFFYLSILPELKERGKTVIVISHDDRYYHIADRILKLEEGTIEYDGCVEEFAISA